MLKINQKVRLCRKYNNGAQDVGVIIGLEYRMEKDFVLNSLWGVQKTAKLYSVPYYKVLIQSASPNERINGRFSTEWFNESELEKEKTND